MKGRGSEKGRMKVGIRFGEEEIQVEKWEGGEGNQVSGNFIHPCSFKD